MYKRKVVKGRLCMGTRGSTLRLHSATQGLGETAWCSQRSPAISAGNCGAAGRPRGADRGGRAAQGPPRISKPLLRPGSWQRTRGHPLACGELSSAAGCRKRASGIPSARGCVDADMHADGRARGNVRGGRRRGAAPARVGNAPPRISGSLAVRLRSRLNWMSMFLKQAIY